MRHKLKLTAYDVTELYTMLGNTRSGLIDTIQKDPKEISVYRIEFITKVSKRFFNKLETAHARKRITMTFALPELLTLRYCLLHRRPTPGMNQLFIEVDRIIHPSMFERSEIIA